ncbi:hypothetical protein [Edwardsiella phage GF-2]|uniref:Uncharacterized protein n=1 Tax=Edwardsiella phage GF-2 TaxID=1537091 RepID=A0A077KAZ0_9CAUD|nr:hypothetical protein VC56_gp37 [Edwardsiella phage GF-2]BAP28908.1 hypothetical protein [Edwardsiella phage GF-2]
MITIIDENNLVTEDGVELVAKIFVPHPTLECCHCCYLYDRLSLRCADFSAPCVPYSREDEKLVIFVEKNHETGY